MLLIFSSHLDQGEELEAGDATTQPHCPQKHCFLAHEARKHTAHSPEGHRIKAGPSLSTSNAGEVGVPYSYANESPGWKETEHHAMMTPKSVV